MIILAYQVTVHDNYTSDNTGASYDGDNSYYWYISL